jgi:hypothetical protein
MINTKTYKILLVQYTHFDLLTHNEYNYQSNSQKKQEFVFQWYKGCSVQVLNILLFNVEIAVEKITPVMLATEISYEYAILQSYGFNTQ